MEGEEQCLSIASISSEGSSESPLVEQEEIAALTHDVRNFKEALGRLRKIFSRDKDSTEPVQIGAHERLGEVLRILRTVLDKYPALQSNEVLVAAGTLIQHVKGYNNEDEKSDNKEFFESIDQLALAFSSRVSEYLMGDLDTNVSLSSSVSSKAKQSCENLTEGELNQMNNPDLLTPEQIDEVLLNLEQGVDFSLHRAKSWSKYVKDIMTYVEKRIHLDMEYYKNLSKLAQTVRSLIKEESSLPFQSIYCTALDNDLDNSSSCNATLNLLLGNKFVETIANRRTEHERIRKELKERWRNGVARLKELVEAVQRTQTAYEQLKAAWEFGDTSRRKDEEIVHRVLEAEATYKAAISEANDHHAAMQKLKLELLQQVRELILQSDGAFKSATVNYFQLQYTLTSQIPIQFQTLYESSKLYEPGSQYMEFVKRIPVPSTVPRDSVQGLFNYAPASKSLLEQERKSADSIDSEEMFHSEKAKDEKSWANASDSDSGHSNLSRDDSRSTSPHQKLSALSSGDELENSNENDGNFLIISAPNKHSLSKAAETHTFRKLKTPSRCRECDSYVYFQGADCSECGLACHKKCLETLAIQCGHKRLPRKMTTFGVDLGQHLAETSALVPHIVCKCIEEIDARGRSIKGIYRVSGVKSKVEKLCQAFENGAELVDLRDIHPNVIANVLKLYLRQLPEPLLTFRLYPDFIRKAKEYSSAATADTNRLQDDLKEIMKKLPRHHYLTLAVLMLHLKRVANDSNDNNMPPSNLGIVFGPTLLRTSEGSASLSSLVDTVHQTKIIELMIIHSEEIFNSEEVATARDYGAKWIKTQSQGIGRSFSFIDRVRKGKELESEKQEDIGQQQISLPVAICHSLSDDFLKHSSDDELPYFLQGDGACKSKTLAQIPPLGTTKIFKGSLKDYQGLEGFSILGSSLPDDYDNAHSRLRKSVSDSSSSAKDRITVPDTAPSIPVIKAGKEIEKVQREDGSDWSTDSRTKPRDAADSLMCPDSLFKSRSFKLMERHSLDEPDEFSEMMFDSSSGWSKKYVREQRKHTVVQSSSSCPNASQALGRTNESATKVQSVMTQNIASTSNASYLVPSTKPDKADSSSYIPVFHKQEGIASSEIRLVKSEQSNSNKHDLLSKQMFGVQEEKFDIKMYQSKGTGSIGGSRYHSSGLAQQVTVKIKDDEGTHSQTKVQVKSNVIQACEIKSDVSNNPPLTDNVKRLKDNVKEQNIQKE